MDKYETIREALDNPELTDEEIDAMNPKDVFSLCLQWEGILGYADIILELLEDVYGCSFEEREFY